MKILVTGATGLVGSELLESLYLQGFDDIRILTRNKSKAQNTIPFPVEIFEWDPEFMEIETGALENIDIIVNLAGENVGEGRWSEERKTSILRSRINGVNLIMEAIDTSHTKPCKFISSSAVGIYGNRNDETLDENSFLGKGFLAEVCKQWEERVLYNNISKMKAYCLRTGVVLSKDGGALSKMLPPFKAGVGGILGGGKQYMSWIHIQDLVGQVIHLIKGDYEQGVYNSVSENPVTNKEFTNTLGKIISRPTLFPVPSFIVKTLFGEMSEILLEGQKVLPIRFSEIGYEFKFSRLSDALSDILKFDRKGETVFKRYQWINDSPEETFSFFSKAENLEKITPEYLNFKILNKNTENIEEGSLIDYQLSLHGLPMKWKTKINQFEEGKSFVDEQLKGPYKSWIHTHDFIPAKSGTLIKDHVVYKVPLGVLGRICAGWYIKNDIEKIFNYRHKVIKESF